MRPSLATFVQFAGVLQLAMAVLAIFVPRILRFRERLAVLSPSLRTLVCVYSAFIALALGGMGVISLVHPESLTDGSALGRTLCALIALFWAARLVVQLFVYEVDSLAPTQALRFGFHALTVCFAYLVGTFLLASVAGVLF